LRVAFSGAHGTGKTTLIAELRHHLAQYEAVEEPYYTLLEEGYRFAEVLSAEDFEVQVARSIAVIRNRGGTNVLFDRSPADYLAYLVAMGGSTPTYLDAWIPPAIEALQTLDRVIFVPVEHPDRIGDSEFPRLRRGVDSILREIWMEDGWGVGASVLEVRGTIPERVRQVLSDLARPVPGPRQTIV
jgi:hypothetical protein